MKTKITIVAVVVIILFVGYTVMANPDNPGRSMVSALSGIQEAILSLAGEPEEAEKEWYHQHFKIDPAQNDALFVVPADRQFVLKRLYAYPYKGSTLWHLAANEITILPGSIIKYSYQTGTQGGITYKFEHDFPDGCVTIDAEETLNTVNEDITSLDIVVIGYFRAMP